MRTSSQPAPWSDQPGASHARLVVLDSVGSTNSLLVDELTGADGRVGPGGRAWPHMSAVQARVQTAGRGRGGRVWLTPQHGALTMSVVARPVLVPCELGWVPLLAGLAVCEAVDELLGPGVRVATKWPNDVVVIGAGSDADVPGWGRARKVAGVLIDMVPGPDGGRGTGREQAPALVVGIGVNVGQGREELPVPWATSLDLVRAGGECAAGALAGTAPDAAPGGAGAGVEAVRDAVGRRLAAVLGGWEAGGAAREGLRDRVGARCATIGQEVEVDLPGGSLRGRAVGVEPGLVVLGEDGRRSVVRAGDVRTVRRRSPGDLD